MGGSRERGESATPLHVPLPPVLGLEAELPFVGRADAWSSLVRAWEQASGGGRRVVLVGGEAGCGKTRLVTELSRWVHGRGGAVVYGPCSEQPSVPYEPFTLAVDQLTASLDPPARHWLLEGRGEELARLVPHLAEPAGGPAAPGPGAPPVGSSAGSPSVGSSAGSPSVGSSAAASPLVASPSVGSPSSAAAPPVGSPPAERSPPPGAAVRPVDPDGKRFRLFGAVTATLGAVAARRPLLVVLDDLHWARRPTLGLLDHLIRSPGLVRVCVVATYRSTAAEVGPDFKAALPDLRRQPGVTRLAIGGFDGDDVRRFVAAAAGHEPTPELEPVVGVLAHETGGNPFLLGELWRHLVETGALGRAGGRWRPARPLGEVSSPEGVREVVAARLDRLPDHARRSLHLAAVVGTSFPIAVVAAAAGTGAGEVLAALDPAVRARIVEEAGPGEHRFVHALVRRAVVDGLSAGERRAHHRDVAVALEQQLGDRAVAEIAHHTLAAVPLVEALPAVAAARRAADAARRAVAHDDAARLLEAALALVPPDRHRCELLLEVADARMRSGDVAAAQERCIEATELARRLGESGLVVAAALAYDDANWRAALHGGVAGDLLLAALPLVDDPAVAVRVRAGLSRALALSGRGDEAEALAEATIADAREVADPAALRLAYAAALFAPWTPANHDGLRAIARELVDRARSEDDLEWELGGIDKLLFGTVMAGDLDEARRLAARHQALSLRVGQPLFRVLDLQAHALLAMGDARFAEAEALAEEADALAGLLSGNDVAGGYGVQIFSIRRDQGRLDEARPLVEAVARLGRASATWRPALAVLYAELGLRDEAARELTFLAADGLAAVPRDSLWWGSLSYLADASVLLGDRGSAEQVYRELVHARGLIVQVGNLLAAYGAADRYLGGLCALLGRGRDAEAHFESALRIDRRARMPVWIARTQLAFGRFLAERGHPGDRERGTAMLRASHDAALTHGMGRVAAEGAELLARLASVRGGRVGRPPRSVAGLTERELAVLPLLVEGRTNREIGERLHISQHTAANHLRSILQKTGCTNRTEAAAWALRQGLAGD